MEKINKDKDRCRLRKYLGKTVTMIVDRPIGYDHDGLVYPVNYGYLPGVMAADGEEQDVYLLGVQEPVTRFTGRIVAIVHREDDIEDKLVMVPEGMRLFRHEIENRVRFQEQFFRSKVEAIWEKSCGGLVFRQKGGDIEYLCLMQKASGIYSAPKGHMEGEETEEETARREILEEAGLRVQLLPDFREKLVYAPFPGKKKELILFLARGEGTLSLQAEEILSASWLPLKEALTVLHSDYAPVLEKAEAYLRQRPYLLS